MGKKDPVLPAIEICAPIRLLLLITEVQKKTLAAIVLHLPPLLQALPLAEVTAWRLNELVPFPPSPTTSPTSFFAFPLLGTRH